MIPGLDIKKERMAVDTAVVAVVFLISYLLGYFQSLDLGAVTVPLMLPNIFLLILAYLHIVLRRGRRYDTYEHRNKYELLKTGLFIALLISSYFSGLSTDGSLIPQNLAAMFFTTAAAVLNTYVMAYRANK